MSQIFVIPRQCMAWILFAQAFVMLPHAERLPLWILGAWAIAAVWRLMIFQGRWSYPGTVVKIVLVVMATAGVVSGYPVKYGLEPAVALLLSGFALKLLEMKSRRDVLVITYLGFFASSLQLLFSQSIASAFYVLLSLLVVSSSLIALHQAAEQERWYAPLHKSSAMFAQSLPLLIAMFLVMPRLPPFWAVPLPSNVPRTGMSASMEPGNVTKLAQSDALAFRVTFKNEVPPNRKLYWRGLALSEFDGRQWRPLSREPSSRPVAQARWPRDAASIDYSMIMESTQQPWLFTIAYSEGDDHRLRYDTEFNLSYKEPIRARLQLKLRSIPDAMLDPQLGGFSRRVALHLPRGRNPKTLELAQQLRMEEPDDARYIDKVLMRFRTENFFYTLQPPQLGLHSVDDFLFGTRRGFCEHYSSAFVVLMRAAGIPARVVVGYQGGARNETERYVTVKQLDAHAWAEVWIEGRGWVLIDPTAAVAPLRIELGSDALRDDAGYLAESPFSPLHFSGIGWLQTLQNQYEQLNYLWHIWVLNHDDERQLDVLKNLLGEVSGKRIAFFMLASGGLTLLLIGLGFWWRSPPRKVTPAIRIYRKYERMIRRHTGLVRRSDEGAFEFSRRVVERRPDLKPHVEAISDQFNEMQYAADRPDPAQIKALRQKVNALRIKRARLR